MVQYYYADEKQKQAPFVTAQSVHDVFCIDQIRVSLWEEHCLECAAPACFHNCAHYSPRQDGRCKRLDNNILQQPQANAVGGVGVRVTFRKWGNLMTVLYPRYYKQSGLLLLQKKQKRLGDFLQKVVRWKVPARMKWSLIRPAEFMFRRGLKKPQTGAPLQADAFVLHAVSHHPDPFAMVLEIYDGASSVYKKSFPLEMGENLFVVPKEELNEACNHSGNTIKLFPENDLAVEIELLWFDFVTGTPVQKTSPAPKVKCVVWDLDNTIWDGILIETDDATKLQLRAGVLETIQALDQRGILQSIASKNDEAPALAQLRALGIADYFLYPQISWNPKSEAVVVIAKGLNINVDTFALVDDTAFERGEVKAALPQVRVFEEKNIVALLDEDCFDVVVTEESKKRRLMYQAEEKRTQIKREKRSDIEGFIASCEIVVTLFKPATAEEKLRCYELILRTNQLNASGIKYTKEAFEQMLQREDAHVFSFSCKDIYGEYGIVGFGQVQIKNNRLHVIEFAMSCRVAGKFLESALFRHLLVQNKLEAGTFTVVKTAKNGLLRKTLEEIGMICAEEAHGAVQYEFGQHLKNDTLITVQERASE